MLQLIRNVVLTSARRDRTEINQALVEAMDEIFHPLALSIHRCYLNDSAVIIFDCAGVGPDGHYCRNAYLPDRRYCRSIKDDPLLARCGKEMAIVLDKLDEGSIRMVFPVLQEEHLLYLIDVTLPADFPADQRVVLMGLTEYFSNHIGLLDYGETDTLTRLSNRKTFDKHLFEVLGKPACDTAEDPNASPHRRQGGGEDAGHWLAVCDIDKFKSINDNFGHLMGDEVLVVLAQLMKSSFRFDDQLFRFGGEEFIAVLQPTNREGAIVVFERFRTAVESHDFSRVGRVTISSGFTRLRPNDLPSDVIGRADEALYWAKQNGRNQACLYEDLVEQGKLKAKVADTNDLELF